jgi:hypothetical protein
MYLREAAENRGAGVIYRPSPGAQLEDGTITGTSDSYVFVLFRGDLAAKAVRPEDLTFSNDALRGI